MILSVVVCTRNRSGLLRNLIESLAIQTFLPAQYEILVVNNASTDDTIRVVQELTPKFTNLRLLWENKIGLSQARNLGWQEAKGDYVGYVDDDCKVQPDWLTVAGEIAVQIQPEVFGGPYYAFYEEPKPMWFKDEYGSHVQGDSARALQTHEFLDGGNMFIRRELLRELGGFRTDLGMIGEVVAFGEETDLFQQIRLRNPRAILYYEPRLAVEHLVRSEKWRLIPTFRRSFIAGRHSFRILHKDYEAAAGFALKNTGYTIVELLKDMTVRFLRRDRARYPYIRNYLYELGTARMIELGTKYEMLRKSRTPP